MQHRLWMIVSFSCLLPFTIPTEASTEFHRMNDGKPVQVHVIEQALDRSHDEHQPKVSNSKVERHGESRTEAGPILLELPLYIV